MTGYTSNDKLLIHCFQDSLSGSTIRWYNLLSRDQIKSWMDLAKAFLVQYKHMMDTTPLAFIAKHGEESHRNVPRVCPQVEGFGDPSSASNDRQRAKQDVP